MRLNNQFSWKTATFMARLSKHAYTGLKDFKKTFKQFINEYAMGLQVPATSFMKPMASMKLRKKESVKPKLKKEKKDGLHNRKN